MSQNRQNIQNNTEAKGSLPTGGFPNGSQASLSVSRLANRHEEQKVLRVL